MTFLFKLSHRISQLRFPAVALLVGGLACSKGEKTDFLSPNPNRETAILNLIRVEPQINSVRVGSELQFTATGYSPTGVIVPLNVDWSATGGIITADGRYTGVLSGTFIVKATAREKPSISDSARVGVWETGDELVALVVSPDSAVVDEGESVNFSAALRMARGDLTGSAAVTWSASGGDLTPAGRFTASEAGEYVVSAMSVNNLRGSARVFVRKKIRQLRGVGLTPSAASVKPNRDTLFSATADWTDGTTTSLSDVEWSSTGGTVSGGRFRAGSTVGAYLVMATDRSSGMADTADVSVVAPSMVRVAISPKALSLAPGSFQQFVAQAELDDGSWRGLQATWQATSGAVTQFGGFTAPAVPGTYRVIVEAPANSLFGGVIATAEVALADTALVTVVQPTATLTDVVLNPSAATIAAGGSRSFSVTGVWSDGSVSTPAVAWSATGGSIDATGLYTAGSLGGTFRVIATAGTGVADTSIVTISAPVPISLTLSPATSFLQPGQAQQFSVSSTLSDGSVTVPTAVYGGGGGSITSAGLYQAGSTTGTYSVIATAQGGTLADTSFVTIASAAPTLSGVLLTPASAVVAPGAAQQFTALGVYSNGSTGSIAISWSGTGGSINSSGRYTAGSTPGNYRVIARKSGGTQADTSAITITSPPSVTSLTVSPKPASVQVGTTAQFSAAAAWSDGSTTLPPILWSSTGGSVSGAGLYSAGATAGTYRVIASHQGGTKSDTSVVTLSAAPPPTATLTALVLSPKPVSLQAGTTRQFSASGTWSDGVGRPVSVSYTASGGTMSSSGLYSAGSLAGTFAVVASCGCGLADTSAVTILAAPVATLSSIAIAPKPAAVLSGATQQFTATAIWSDGTSTLPTLTWSATGGTITGGGLYTAGGTAGTFRAIATGGARADTAAVTITASAPAPTGVVFSDDFESGLGQWEDVNSVHIGTAQAHSGTRSLELSYTAGSSDAGWAWRKGLVPDQATQHSQYIRWWQRWSPGFSFYNGSGSDQKLIQLQALSPQNGWAQSASWKLYLHLVGQTVSGVSPSTLYPERFIWDGTSQWSGQWQGFSPSAASPYAADRWICTEVQVKHNTPGQPNGELRVWVDGTLTNQQTGVKFRDGAVSWNALQITGYYDGGSPKAQTSWVDDIVVGTSPIGCGAASPSPATLSGFILNPSSVTLSAGATYAFTPSAVWTDGSTALPAVTWAATGGTVSSTGVYTAGNTTGTYRVVASGAGKADTSVVTISTSPLVTALSMTPASTTLLPGASQQFTTVATWSDGANRPVSVTYTGTGGTISVGGIYAAGLVAGSFSVVATCSCGYADTSAVQITASGTPVLTSLSLSPSAATVAPGASLQLSLGYTWNTGSSLPPTVTYTATAGGVSSSGLYTAPATLGDHRVIVAQVGGVLKDTTIVTVQNLTPWLVEDFSGIGSTTALRAAPWMANTDYTFWGDLARGVALDPTDGFGGSPRSMKVSWTPGDGGFGVALRLPAPTTEYWTEIWAKFSTTFSSNGTCGGNNPDYKFVFWALQPADGRNEIKVGNYGDMNRLDTRYNWGPDVLAINSSSPINSGQWHRYRVHNKVGANGGSIFNVEYWDGANAPQVLKQEGFSLSYSQMDYIVLGANRNCNAAADMWLKWGRITLYNQNPGWGF